MEPIFNDNGRVVAWLRGDEVLELGGNHRAFVRGSDIISYHGGRHVGWFDQGVFWDSGNLAIGMLREMTALLPRPGLGGVPGRPGIGGRPGRPGLAGSPGKPGKSNSWSTQDWDSWLPAR